VGQLVDLFEPSEEAEITAAPEDAEVVDVPESSQYELRLGDRRIGVAAYHRRQNSNRIAFVHTEVDPACEGRGFGSKLVAAVLGDVRRKGLEVVPLCPFIAHYMATHPEVHDLLASGHRDRVTAA
jgi:predicted GNAT family acetyltransferase